MPRDGHWDFVISNYAFSEFDADLEQEYLSNVLKKARSGYLTMNSGLSDAGQWGKQSYLPVEHLLAELPNAILISERPVIYPTNYIILFGDHCAGRGTSLKDMRAMEKDMKEEYVRFQAAAKTRRAQEGDNTEPPLEPADANMEDARASFLTMSFHAVYKSLLAMKKKRYYR